jgi:GNAT superfamily N-acetyltransferase
VIPEQAPLPFTIRRGTAADVGRLAAINRATALHAYRDIFPEEAPKPTEPDLAGGWARALARGAVFVADGHDGPVGGVHAMPLDPITGEIGGLYVLPTWWGRGIGTALHEEAMGHLRSIGCAVAELWVLERNAVVRAWYERLGWQLVEGRTRVVHGSIIDLRYRHPGPW